MSNWRSQFNQHRIHGLVSDYHGILNHNSLKASKLSRNRALTRLRKLDVYLRKIVASADPDVFPPSLLNAVADGLNPINAKLREFLIERRTSILTDAANLAGSFFDTIGAAAVLISNKRVVGDLSLKVIQESADELLSAIEARSHNIEEKEVFIEKTIEELKDQCGWLMSTHRSERQKEVPLPLESWRT